MIIKLTVFAELHPLQLMTGTVSNPVISRVVEAGQIHLGIFTVLLCSRNSSDTEEALFGQDHITGSMPLLTPGHSFRSCGGPYHYHNV